MSSLQNQSAGISVDFLVGEKNVPVPVLAGILSSLQQAIYVVGAYETGRERLRGEARRRYTLAVSSAHHSDLHIALLPLIQIAAEQLSLFGQVGINVASNVLYDAAKYGFSRMKAHYQGDHPQTSIIPETPDLTPETIRDQALWQASCKHAAEVTKLGGSVRTSLRTPDGSEVMFDATPSSAARIIETEAILRGQAQKYKGCEMRKITIPGPTLHARIPTYGNAEIRCVGNIPTTMVSEANVRLYHHYTIVGTPIWARSKPSQGKQTRIEVITLEDAAGDIILASVLDDEDYVDHGDQEAVITEGLFTSSEEAI